MYLERSAEGNVEKQSVPTRRRWISKGYHSELERLFLSIVPVNSRVLEVGCGAGALLACLKPCYGLGIDINPANIEMARRIHSKHDSLAFKCADAEKADWKGDASFDYIILSDVLSFIDDVQNVFTRLHKACNSSTRVVVNFPSNLWRPAIGIASLLRLKERDERFNWLSRTDVVNLFKLSGFEVVTSGTRVLLPFNIPGLKWIFNRLLAKLPFLEHLCLAVYVVARPVVNISRVQQGCSVSIVIPTRDERGNIEDIFKRTPPLGAWSELVFVDGASTDGTVQEIERCMQEYKRAWKRVILLKQTGKGKGQAVHQGFAECHGDILMILDSDLTMPPEELPKYYGAIVSGQGEFINGNRLVYPLEGEAMRFLNMVANHIFAKLFSWLLGQPIKDTLCGTKVLWKDDYKKVMANRSLFGDFDPFGDFDLLFGVARLNRKIVDMPIRYKRRTYGDIKIQRWRHGLLLLRMSLIGFRKFKLN